METAVTSPTDGGWAGGMTRWEECFDRAGKYFRWNSALNKITPAKQNNEQQIWSVSYLAECMSCMSVVELLDEFWIGLLNWSIDHSAPSIKLDSNDHNTVILKCKPHVMMTCQQRWTSLHECETKLNILVFAKCIAMILFRCRCHPVCLILTSLKLGRGV